MDEDAPALIEHFDFFRFVLWVSGRIGAGKRPVHPSGSFLAVPFRIALQAARSARYEDKDRQQEWL